MPNDAVFIDANVFVYFLDETSDWHEKTVTTLQRLLETNHNLYTSHHVLEEVLFIVSRLAPDRESVVDAVDTIAAIPNLSLVEPPPDISFAKRYARLYQKSKAGLNDTLLLQLMQDAGITALFSYDAAFLKQAQTMGIVSATDFH